MATQALFLSVDGSEQHLFDDVCRVAAECYSQRLRTAIVCKDKQQAEQIDELLWQLPTERFVPHNLDGEGPNGGAPVEIFWSLEKALRPVLINVAAIVVPFPHKYQRIYEFVLSDEHAKQAARMRYKTYQQAGCDMQYLQTAS